MKNSSLWLWTVFSLNLAVVMGCSGARVDEADQGGAAVLAADDHQHYHVHAVDVEHEHTHPEEKNGGHTHDHQHVPEVESTD